MSARYPRGYTIYAASTPALRKWQETHARLVSTGQTGRGTLDMIEAELAERQEKGKP